MKELLQQYAAYNVWANMLIIDALLKLDDDAIHKEITSSFPSIYAIVVHTWSAEHIWMERLQLAEQPTWVASDFNGSFAEACNGWRGTSAALQQFTDKQYDDRAFQHVLQYYDRQKVSHKMPVYQVLQHVYNHGTYHRGQLVTMMRQAGAKDVPGTDFLLFARKK